MNAHLLRNSLPRTWGAFFRRYGNFTPAQTHAIPLLLAGRNLILCAPTASGKTEAALAPLIERYLPPVRPIPQLTLVYLLPTRALINDLLTRLSPPLEALRVSVATKTHDFNTFNPKVPSDLLLTTPESLDSLLAAHPKVLNAVRAVIIDELHIFDGTVRGNQLCVVLRRLQQIRAHALKVGDAPNDQVQFAALSATLAEPHVVAARYFTDAQALEIPGNRVLDIEMLALEADTPNSLLAYLSTFRQRGWRKALVFCNTRAEVEAYATAVRSGQSPFGEGVFVHYSNLERERRHEIEQQFAQAETAICFSSSTLELGIDIGNIDVTLLVGAPGSAESFFQRVGRANRRGQKARAACFYRTPLERAMFDALPNTALHSTPLFFIPSIAIQQIFSLLKQNPQAALRLNPLCELFEGLLSAKDVREILGELQAKGYLKQSRMGEWRADERLNHLIDQQSLEYTPLSLYSNIQTEAGQMKIRDQHSQRVVANVNRQWLERDTLTLEGRTLNVTWYDGEALWVSARQDTNTVAPLRYLSARQALSYELAQQIPRQSGLQAGAAPLVSCERGWLVFHWLGDIYGWALLDLVRHTIVAHDTEHIGLCLLLHDDARALPQFTPEQVTRYLRDNHHRYEPLLALGAYHYLLPGYLRRRTVIEQFNVPRFVQAVDRLHLERAPEGLNDDLQSYLQ